MFSCYLYDVQCALYNVDGMLQLLSDEDKLDMMYSSVYIYIIYV